MGRLIRKALNNEGFSYYVGMDIIAEQAAP